MTLPKSLREKRDAGAQKYALSEPLPPREQSAKGWGYAVGYDQGVADHAELVRPILETIDKATLRIPNYHTETCGTEDYHCNCGITKMNEELRQSVAAYREAMETGAE